MHSALTLVTERIRIADFDCRAKTVALLKPNEVTIGAAVTTRIERVLLIITR